MESDAHSVRVALTAVAPPPPFPHLSELLPREHRQVRREPFAEEDEVKDAGHALLGRHSKLYQRRREVEAELKQEFSLPEEATAVLRELRSRRATPIGCPPPVPKPRVGKSKLPPIPKPLEPQHRPPRWGMPDTSENDAAVQAHSQIPWWKLEQETLARRSSERGSERKAPAEHRDQKDPLLGGAGEAFDRTLQKRPQSWRMGRPEKLESPARPEPPLLIAEDLKHDDVGRGFGEPWRIKAKELQAIAAAHRSNAKRREADSLGRQPEGYPAEEGEVPKHPSGDHFRELHRREELRFEEMKQEELRRLEREREENRKRRQEQEEWEQAMRRKFAEEAEQLKAARRVQKEVEEQEEKKFKEGAQRRQAMKQEEAREREEAKKRRQEQDEWEQAMRRKIAVEAEQLNAAQRSKQRTQDQHNQDVRRSQGEKEKKQSEASQHQRFGSEAKARVGTPRSADPSPPRHPRPSQSPQGHRSGRLKSVSTSTRNLQASGLAELQAAKSAAMRQLIILRQHPSKEARQKGFKDLLRMWHPDKNPGSPEVATAVFQMIQAERGRVFK